jgi:GNAT superfamily N-acetyltransferase
MDDPRYRTREFREDDYAAEARLSNRIGLSEPTTSEELRHWDASMTAPHLVHRKFVVEEVASATIVASGGLQQVPFNYHPHKFWTSVQVDPDHRRRGIGQRLYELVEREATERSAIGVWASARSDDPAGLAFLARQGFVEQRRVWISRLELAHANLSALSDRSATLAAEGIRFSTLAEEGEDRPEVRQRLHGLWDRTGQDIPIVGKHTPVPFEQFVRLELESPYFLSDAVFLAIHGQEYVGMSTLDVPSADPETLHVGFTGTIREFRGRGIATELKRRAVEYARGRGYRYLRTGNDSLNAPIWAINERLGFRRERTWVNAEKTFPGKT